MLEDQHGGGAVVRAGVGRRGLVLDSTWPLAALRRDYVENWEPSGGDLFG